MADIPGFDAGVEVGLGPCFSLPLYILEVSDVTPLTAPLTAQPAQLAAI